MEAREKISNLRATWPYWKIAEERCAERSGPVSDRV